MAGKSGQFLNPIGLDLSGDTLRAVQLASSDTTTSLVEAVALPGLTGEEDAVRSAVMRLLRRYKFTGSHVATAVPSDRLSIEHLRLTTMPRNQVDSALASALAERLPYPVEEAVVRHVEICGERRDQGHTDYMALAVPRETVEGHLRIAERLGLTVGGISVLPMAIGHAFSYLGQRREESGCTFLLLHVEPRVTHLVIMSGGEVRFGRTIREGSHDILAAGAEATGREFASLRDEQEMRIRRPDDSVLLSSRMTEAPDEPHVSTLPYAEAGRVLDHYVEEIVSCMCYYASNVDTGGVDKAIFVGSQANDYGFCQLVANRIGVPAQIGDPFAGVRMSEEHPQESRRPRPEMAVAVGLSLFGAMVN